MTDHHRPLMRLVISGASSSPPQLHPASPPTPTRTTIRMIVPFAAGGPTDVIGRMVARAAIRRPGPATLCRGFAGRGRQSRCRDRQTGRSRRLYGHGRVDRLHHQSEHVFRRSAMTRSRILRRSRWSPPRPTSSMVHPSVPAKNLKELIDTDQGRSRQIQLAQPATGSTPHLAGRTLEAELQPRHPWCRSPARRLRSTPRLGNHTPIAFTALPPACTVQYQGRQRCAASRSWPISASPRCRTCRRMLEEGVPGLESDTSPASCSPAGTPQPSSTNGTAPL